MRVRVQTDPASEARRLYANGKSEYARGKFNEAIVLFERAYAVSKAPGLLFNLAQAHRLAGDDHCPEAYALYESYLAAEPAADNRREVEERIAELSPCANPSADASAPVPETESMPSANIVEPAPPALTPATPVARDPLGPALTPPALKAKKHTLRQTAIVTGVGLAILVAGSVLYAEAAAKHREAERECPCYPGAYSKWEKLTKVSYAAMSVGGTVLVSGFSWWVFGAPRSPGSAGHLSVGLRGRF